MRYQRQPAFALLCTRYSLDHSGFVDIAAAASWYPETLNIPDKNFQEIEGQKSVRSTRFVSYRAGNDRFEREVVYQLLPSRKLLASLRKIGGFKLPGDARYNCNPPRTGKAKLAVTREQTAIIALIHLAI